ncbi:hypothetical protein [Sinorhizobium sp. RAC02]|uniref:hypothetical protein n=1 Tax=Sinorhizobium sp. RAC02 TaxID=1842534 RepID=UPI00083E1C75|nr:hypothetical protein [Sinorhizobium sp. RAC02]AOF88408.1 hypothetical protein BSY16_7 [Sinorhizobium sp. RAC02]
MANLVITAASVLAGADASGSTGHAGEAITAGQAVYLSSTTKKWMLGDSNSATAEARQAKGIALNNAALDQPINVHRAGDLTLGAVLTPGVAYYLSDTPGAICPVADVGSGEYVCLLGLAKSMTVLAVDIQFPNVAL